MLHPKRPVPRFLLLSVLYAALALSMVLRARDSSATVLLDSSWPMYGHDVKHTFRSALLGPTDGHLLDPTPIGNACQGQAAVTSDGVFVFGCGSSTVAVRADGLLLWRTLLEEQASISGPALDTSGFLYVGSRDNQLWKKDLVTGDAACRTKALEQGDIKSSPTISVKFPDRVYVLDTNKFLYAMGTGETPGTCAPIWSVRLERGSVSSVSLADTSPGNGDAAGNLVVAAGKSVYLVDDGGVSGTVVASRRIGRIRGATPLVHPDTGNIYLGSMDHRLYALRPDLTDLFPPVDLGSRIYSSAALSADGTTIYVPTDRGRVYALDAATGAARAGFPYVSPSQKNRFKLAGYAPVVDGAGNIFFGGNDDHVRALAPDGSLVWDVQIGGRPAAATIVDGGLLVPSVDGDFMLHRFCPDPTGPPEAESVCGFTIDTTVP